MAVLLAGGRSVRMGQDKAWLTRENKPLWQHQAETLQRAGASAWLLACRPEQGLDKAALEWSEAHLFPLRLVHDPVGCTAGVLGVLARCLRTAGQGLLVVPVDMPHLDPALLEPLWPPPGEDRGGFWQRAQGLEPFPGYYPLSWLPVLETALQLPRAPALTHLLENARADGLVHTLPLLETEAWRMANWNTPQDRQQNP